MYSNNISVYSYNYTEGMLPVTSQSVTCRVYFSSIFFFFFWGGGIIRFILRCGGKLDLTFEGQLQDGRQS